MERPAGVRAGLQAPYDARSGRRLARYRMLARRTPQYPIPSGVYRVAGADAGLAGGGSAVACRVCRGRAFVGGRLPGRCAVERGRSSKELVRAGEISTLVPSAVSRDARRDSAGGALRRPGFLNDRAALNSALIGEARALGFDAVGVARPDAIPQAKDP